MAMGGMSVFGPGKPSIERLLPRPDGPRRLGGQLGRGGAVRGLGAGWDRLRTVAGMITATQGRAARRVARQARRRRWWRALGGRFVIALTMGTLAMGGGIWAVRRGVDGALGSIPKVSLTLAAARAGGANYLVIGSDSREFVTDDGGRAAFGDSEQVSGRRSDTIMVVHLEPDAERALVVSFPRDLWVDIPGRGQAKLNAAYDAGPQAVVDTLAANFGVEIQHYVEVDFPSFVQLVDTVGSIPIYVPYAARDGFTGFEVPHGGCWPLRGDQALGWVRSRSLEYQDPASGRWVTADPVPDIGRIARQQDFLRRVVSAALDTGLRDPRAAIRTAGAVLSELTVDDGFDRSAALELASSLRTTDITAPGALELMTLPWRTGPNQQGQSVLYPDDAAAGPVLERLGRFDGPGQGVKATIGAQGGAGVTVRVVNATGRPGLDEAVARRLARLGYRAVAGGARKATASSRVVGQAAQLAAGRALLSHLEPDAALAEAEGDLGRVRVKAGEGRTRAEAVMLELVVGRSFQGLVVDQLGSVTSSTSAPSTSDSSTGVPSAAEPAVAAESSIAPPQPAQIDLGPGAPREGC